LASGYSFIFDGIASDAFGLSIAYLNDFDWKQASGGSNSLTTDQLTRSAAAILLNVEQSPVLKFNIDIVSENKLDMQELITIKNWLFGSKEYKKLQIVSDGFAGTYFNCFLMPENDFMFATGFHGISCSVECDSPYVMEFSKKKVYTYTGESSTQRFFNVTADLQEIKPKITFKMNGAGNFSITNQSYNNLLFAWDSLLDEETITCDCMTGIITSSTQLRRFFNFNKTFLKLKNGVNTLLFTGNISELTFEYQNRKRIGGGIY